MKLSFDVYDLRPLHTFHVARPGAETKRRTVLVRIESDGMVGWGEAAPINYYGETVETVTAVLPRLASAIEASAEGDVLALDRIERAMERAIGKNAAARAAVSNALHDLAGQRLGVPVWKMWGLDAADAPLSSFTIGIDEPEVMRQKLEEAATYPILKVKLGTDRDEELLRTIRDAAPAKTLRVDANTAWTAKQTLRYLPMLEEYAIELLEQPVAADDLEGLRLIRQHSTIPVVADESCRTAADIPRLVGCVDAVNLKLAKCGGMREAMRLIHAARVHNLGVMLGCMMETTAAIAAAVQLAPTVDWIDVDGAALLAEDPFRGPGLESDGRIRFNTTPGLGLERIDG